MKIAFIINGKGTISASIKDVIRSCKTHPDLDVYQFETGKQKDAIRMAKACSEKKFHAIIAVGGDGTVNEVLNGIMELEDPKPLLGILPCGTGNDFIAGTGMPVDLKLFISSLLNANIKKVDVGLLQTKTTSRYFLNIADIGFGGKVVQVLNKQRKFIQGKSSYGLAILRTFFGFRKPVLYIKADNFEYQGTTFMLSICNGKTFGNGLTINPHAKIDDGILNLTLLGHINIFHYLRNLKNLKKGVEIIHPEVKYVSTKKVEVKIIHGLAYTETDGEFVDNTDITAEIVPGAIDLIWY